MASKATQNKEKKTTQNIKENEMYCPHCGKVMFKEAEICPNCGMKNMMKNKRNIEELKNKKIIAIILALFLGGLGIHRFYLGHTTKGILYLIFFWTLIPALVALIDALIYATTPTEKFEKHMA